MQQGDAGMSANEWRPKVGERVAIYAEIIAAPNENDRSFGLKYPDRGVRWLPIENISPLPAPRQPWDVLREAAGAASKAGYEHTAQALLCTADRLEAAAAPKPPTLREAAATIESTRKDGA